MRRTLRRRLAALAAVAVAGALLLPQVAAAQPDTQGSQGARPAARAAAVGAPRSAPQSPGPVNKTVTLTAVPNGCNHPPGCCPIAPGRAGAAPHRASQSAPQAGCGPPPPPSRIECILGARQPSVSGPTGFRAIQAAGVVACQGGTPVSVSIIVTLEKQFTPPPIETYLEVPGTRVRYSGPPTVVAGGSGQLLYTFPTSCVPGTYTGTAQATVTVPPGYILDFDNSGKVVRSPPLTVQQSDC
jgi:hypothetical protein